MSRLAKRRVPAAASARLESEGVHPLLARLYAGRGIRARAEVDYRIETLLDPGGLRGIDAAATLLADCVQQRRRILVIADYDCDGATAGALAVRALRAMGGDAGYLVPNRFEYGYGLSPELVREAATRQPHLLVTVDNGIASLEGVDEARRLGIPVLITDHHLPGETLPSAEALVNPNQPGCAFESKHLAGVGVMFYVAAATRAELRRRGQFAGRHEPNLGALLDLVALGTVADVVRLDRNNRLLVAQGLSRIRAGRAQPGIRALLQAAGRDPARAATFDMGFAVGPRINAAGRLADMSAGIECLLAEDYGKAAELAVGLDQLNRDRRAIESDMQAQALALLERADAQTGAAITLFDPGWHQGIVGLLAGRVKERVCRPVIAFARGANGELKGSGRSIEGVHLRDALDLVTRRLPGVIRRFGGHAAAAGVTILERDLDEFRLEFARSVEVLADPEAFSPVTRTDGAVEGAYLSLECARMIDAEVWGQGFPAPLFDDEFDVDNQRLVKDRHLKVALRKGSARFEAIWFNRCDPLPARARIAFRITAGEFGGVSNLDLHIQHGEPA